MCWLPRTDVLGQLCTLMGCGFLRSHRHRGTAERCSMKALVILALAILLPVLAYQPDRPDVAQVSPDDETYEVYSAAIRELYLNEDEKAEGSTGTERLVVIRDRTSTSKGDSDDR